MLLSCPMTYKIKLKNMPMLYNFLLVDFFPLRLFLFCLLFSFFSEGWTDLLFSWFVMIYTGLKSDYFKTHYSCLIKFSCLIIEEFRLEPSKIMLLY